LGKKVLIANSVAMVADQIFSMPVAQLSFSLSWLGAICYTLQIYFDFSGYSDMAIGLGRMLGFDFMENFNYPYISKSIREFWRRWHISLSTWLRDYLYIPLGGNRKGTERTYINLLIVFFLCGLWHGANWTFVIWGLWHGLFLAVERTRFGKTIDSHNGMGVIYTLMVVLIGWVFFRSDTLANAINYLRAMIGMGEGVHSASMFLDLKTIFAILLGVVGSTPITAKIKAHLQRAEASGTLLGRAVTRSSNVLSLAYVYFVFALSVIFISMSTYNPFIYFQF
jgi:alginate O-acetyltransferase complex protein AlgI